MSVDTLCVLQSNTFSLALKISDLFRLTENACVQISIFMLMRLRFHQRPPEEYIELSTSASGTTSSRTSASGTSVQKIASVHTTAPGHTTASELLYAPGKSTASASKLLGKSERLGSRHQLATYCPLRHQAACKRHPGSRPAKRKEQHSESESRRFMRT